MPEMMMMMMMIVWMKFDQLGLLFNVMLDIVPYWFSTIYYEI